MASQLVQILDNIQKFGASTHGAERRKLMHALHEAAHSLEDTEDTINRFAYLHLQTAAVRTGFDLKLFEILCSSKNHVDAQRVAEENGIDTLLTSRLLRYMAAIGVISENEDGRYLSNNITENLATGKARAGISHCFETIGPQYQELPSFLRHSNYRNPTNEMNTVFQSTWKTEKHAFTWFQDHPENLHHFNNYMALRRDSQNSWLSVYPVEEEAKGWNQEIPVFVNVGGGIGHQCAQFRTRYPSMPGRVILQDMPHSVEQALQISGVESMASDFFESQPIKGAKFYFSRGVLHNHPDRKVLRFLEISKAAMGPESVLLLDEMVLPRTGVNAYAAGMDLTMMGAFAAMERTEEQWSELLAKAGLKLKKVYSYNPSHYECVLDVRTF